MSWEATSWALREAPAPTPTARLVLIALADRCGRDGRSAWPSIETLALEAHTSESTVWRTLSAMEKAGVIARGDQMLATHDEHGQYLPPQYRPIVWVLNMGVTLEHVAEKPGKKARLEREERAARLAAEKRQEPIDENGGIEPNSRLGNLHTLDSRLGTSAESRLCTSAYLYKETNTYTNSSPTPKGVAPQKKKNAGSVSAAAQAVCEHLASARSSMRLSAPAPTSNDLKAADRLIARAASTCDDPVAYIGRMIDFALKRTFFARTVRGGADLLKRFDAICDDMVIDEREAQEQAQRKEQEDAQTHVSMTANLHVHDAHCDHVLKIVDSSTPLNRIAPRRQDRHAFDDRVAEWLNAGVEPRDVVDRLFELLREQREAMA